MASDLLEAIRTTPSVRYLRPDPIPESVLWQVLDAAIRGPSPGNRQPWGWVVVQDRKTKEQIAEWFREGWRRSYGGERAARFARASQAVRRNVRASKYLADHLEEVPVIVVPVLMWAQPATPTLERGSAIYGAIQNLVLAARSLGIGSTLSGFYKWNEEGMKDLLKLPEEAETMGLVPLGYPLYRGFVVPNRRPVEEVVHWDAWGNQRQRPAGDRRDDRP